MNLLSSQNATMQDKETMKRWQLYSKLSSETIIHTNSEIFSIIKYKLYACRTHRRFF